MTKFKRGPGPHTGVHLIIVRKDLATIIHRHPPIAPDGTISETVVFTKPGPYRVVVDVYPRTGPQPNFQLQGSLRVAGAYHPQKLPPFASTDVVDGYRITIHGRPTLHAIQAGDAERHGHRSRRKAADVHAVVRRPRSRDLLP